MKLRTRLSLTFSLVVLLTVLLISLLANVIINNEFKKYIQKQQEQTVQEIIANLSAQYYETMNAWDLNFLHTIGMHALSEGYIVKIFDANGYVLWDAESCDMEACRQLINDITEKMSARCCNNNGGFVSKEFPLYQNTKIIGTSSISYYSPYFLKDNDHRFLDTLNLALLIIGISSLGMSLVVGWLLSKRISEPIGKAVKAAIRMAEGDYVARMEISDSTKELADLADSVNHLAQSLSYQESLRKQLTADVAHELRTPITSVQTHMEAMIEGMWELTTERLSSCYDEMGRISTLVADLENLAKVDNNIKLDKKPIDISFLINKAIGCFEMEIENKGLSVTVSGSVPEVLADEDRIHQVVVNLLSNAIKYTPQNGHIDITLSNIKNFVTFTVADDGIGISETELPFIFERFYRAEKSRNRKTGGSGIGLAVVKAIVGAHSGKVDVESNIGTGSRFRVMLPLNQKPLQ